MLFAQASSAPGRPSSWTWTLALEGAVVLRWTMKIHVAVVAVVAAASAGFLRRCLHAPLESGFQLT